MICEPFVVPRVIVRGRSRLMTLEDIDFDTVRSEIGDRLMALDSRRVEDRINRCMTILTILLDVAEHAEMANFSYAATIVYKRKTIVAVDRDTHNGELAAELNTHFPIFEKAIQL